MVLIALSIGFLVAMRGKYPPVLTAVRRMNRRTFNPMAMKTAGQPGATASIVRHVGRTSGTPYETPIGPYTTDDGFVVALPYGTTPDWLKNVLAADSAVIVHEGVTYRVDHPEVVSAADALSSIPRKVHRSLRIFNVDQFLRVRRVELQETPGEADESV
jgi:deazaflavin-dependent oxidoreductase (nitroreductase family)